MHPTTKTLRTQVTRRLRGVGFPEPTAIRIAGLTNAILEGITPLAHVLVAAMETCRACGLTKTHLRLADAVACLAAEVMQEAGIRPPPAGQGRGQGPRSPRAETSTAHAAC